MTQMRPEYALAAGFLDIAEPGKDDFRVDLLAGALFIDARLTRKLFRELDVIHEMVNPFIPPYVIGRPSLLDAESRLPAYKENVDFQDSLRTVPVPSPVPQSVIFSPEPAPFPSRHATPTETTHATAAAS